MQATLFDDACASEIALCEAIDALHASTAIYTAAPAVDALLERLGTPRNWGRLIDPSCGDGMFLARATEKLLECSAVDDAELPKLIAGWEIHKAACEDARVRVSSVLQKFGRSVSAARALATEMIVNRDFLSEGPQEPCFDTVAGNPPYLRWLKIPELLRERYAVHVPQYAASDMLHSFLARCASTLRSGGRIGLITSDRWLFGEQAAELREVVGRRLRIDHLERLDPRSTFYRPKHRVKGSLPRIHPVSVVLADNGRRPLSRQAVYPGTEDEDFSGWNKLGEVASVRLAPWIGKEGLFLLPREHAVAVGIPESMLVDAFDTDDISEGALRAPLRVAIRTDPKAMPCPEILSHLQANANKVSQSKAARKFWLPPESFHQLDLERPSLFIPRILKEISPTPVPAGALAINHNLVVSCGTKHELAVVERVLRSPTTWSWLEKRGHRLEGGYLQITVPLLRQLPVPPDSV